MSDRACRARAWRIALGGCVAFWAAIALLAAAALSGCAHRPAAQTLAEVPVAVPCPPPPPTVRPRLPIAELQADSAPGVVLRAYEASVVLLAGYAEHLEQLLDSYRNHNKHGR
ncbi:MAG: hypothetical protein ACOY5C_04895 [Pseudomonadota bacterium]